jgi:hypothetical protein
LHFVAAKRQLEVGLIRIISVHIDGFGSRGSDREGVVALVVIAVDCWSAPSFV